MKLSKPNYLTIFLLLFRIAIIIETLYFIIKGQYGDASYCILTFIVTFAINIFYKFTKLNPSNFIKFILQIFIFLSMFLGHVNKMYHHIPVWDDILHIISGFIGAFFAYIVLDKFIEINNTSKYFVVLFIIIFSIALAGIWEMFEFTTDTLFSLMSQGGSLSDTMIDIINGSIGPIIISILYLIRPKIFNNLQENPRST